MAAVLLPPTVQNSRLPNTAASGPAKKWRYWDSHITSKKRIWDLKLAAVWGEAVKGGAVLGG